MPFSLASAQQITILTTAWVREEETDLPHTEVEAMAAVAKAAAMVVAVTGAEAVAAVRAVVARAVVVRVAVLAAVLVAGVEKGVALGTPGVVWGGRGKEVGVREAVVRAAAARAEGCIWVSNG
uniref:Uncharacterized protein n=1 Tax=Haptolina ericina TaxID=156174 RepID=A0A7S3EZC6_9EUKA|mmetsp:Transcript_35276/g.79983  ORF Transcript_35276/g.79983 Transcript_35276/m.79983 type:complete len:123 (+) Transcript_35276:220-588(+)